jgi:SAM-dependent methyltransferase
MEVDLRHRIPPFPRLERTDVRIAIRKRYLRFLKAQNARLSALSCHAMKWRGFSESPIHPKHLFDSRRKTILHDILPSGARVLDLGSGVGTDCIALARQGAVRVIGIEGNEKNIGIARERSRAAGVDVEFLQLDLETERLPFPDDLFDAVNFTNVLEHLDNRVGILRELKRVKKDDGIVVLSVPNSDTSWKRSLRSAGIDSRDDPDHKTEYDARTLQQELEDAGLRIVSPLLPIVPSSPWNGLIAISAGLSPALYRYFQARKYRSVEKKPEESIGWVFVAK